MSSESVRERSATAIEKRGNPKSAGAIHCTVARAIWPDKTAEHWASRSGVKQRMAKYWLSGRHPVSAGGKLAIIRLLDK